MVILIYDLFEANYIIVLCVYVTAIGVEIVNTHTKADWLLL